MIRVLVCGGRDYDDFGRLFEVMETIRGEQGGFSALIHGGARGADELSGFYAETVNVPITAFPADWKTHKKAAGPIRNQQMITEGKPDLVVAFPGSRGTADMVRRARKSGIEVVEIP